LGNVTRSLTGGATRKLVLAALFEPLGTVFVGATLGALLISPFIGEAAGGLFALMVAFALSSIPGAIIGYLVLKALRRTGSLG
jgi:energy coupling factor transporter S component ThiW